MAVEVRVHGFVRKGAFNKHGTESAGDDLRSGIVPDEMVTWLEG